MKLDGNEVAVYDVQKFRNGNANFISVGEVVVA